MSILAPDWFLNLKTGRGLPESLLGKAHPE
jgi:hypothetical protein